MTYVVRNINPLDTKLSTGIGVQIPFSSKSVFTTVYTTQEQLKYNIINYLLTNKKERVFNPNFGAGLRDKLFENITEDYIYNIQEVLKSNLESTFNNIIVSTLYINPDIDNHIITLNISYEIANTGLQDEININFQNG